MASSEGKLTALFKKACAQIAGKGHHQLTPLINVEWIWVELTPIPLHLTSLTHGTCPMTASSTLRKAVTVPTTTMYYRTKTILGKCTYSSRLDIAITTMPPQALPQQRGGHSCAQAIPVLLNSITN